MERKIWRKQCSLALMLLGDFPNILGACWEQLLPVCTDSEQSHLQKSGLGCAPTGEEQWIPLSCQELPLQGWPRKASSPSSLRKPTAKSQACSSGLWEPLWSTATRETDVNRAKPLRSEKWSDSAFSQVPGAEHSGFSKQNPYSETGALNKN